MTNDIATRIWHETQPPCCGCIVIQDEPEGVCAVCNECDDKVELTEVIQEAMK